MREHVIPSELRAIAIQEDFIVIEDPANPEEVIELNTIRSEDEDSTGDDRKRSCSNNPKNK
jgi:hypothetical protein